MLRRTAPAIFLGLIGLLGCTRKENETIKRFQLVPPEISGIDFANNLQSTDSLNIVEYLYYYNGAGVAIGDFDNDGLDDIVFTANQGSNKLYHNQGSMTFEDISESSGISGSTGWSTGVTIADVNQDGFLDIYICQVSGYKGLTGANLLYINNGDLTFSEMGAEVGLGFSGFSTQAAFFDYDRDGDLDMYLLNHAVHTVRSYGPAITRQESDPVSGDRLFENQLAQGQLTFVDVTQKAGIYSSAQGFGLGLVATDINQDGWVDLYVGNDFHENDYLYINQQNGTFLETLEAQVNHSSRFTMGVDIADINGDGYQDIFSLDMLPEDHEILMKSGAEDPNKVTEIKLKYGYAPQYAHNAFQLHNGNLADPHFSEISLMTNTYATDWSWSVLLQDYNNDGLTDIFISNGIRKRPNDLDYINFLSNVNFAGLTPEQQDSVEKALVQKMPELKIANYAYENRGNLQFENVSELWGLSEESYSNGTAYADLDRDGDLDLVVNNIDMQAFVYENKTNELDRNHFIQFNLYDSLGHWAYGARLEVYASTKKWIKELLPTRGFTSAVSPTLHVGLGQFSQVDSVLVFWPDGGYAAFLDLPIDTLIHLKEGKYVPQKPGIGQKTEPVKFAYTHQENNYKDYDLEVLIPEKLSTEGPCGVSADFNQDGILDLYLGGARNQNGVLMLQSSSGDFKIQENLVFQIDAGFEDVDAAALDFDLDGDMDLYVVSGGNDLAEGDLRMSDRLYINDGQGNFRKAAISLPTTNGGTVAVADYDGDNYPDLFVGSRSIPGAYGLFPESYVLKNMQGTDLQVMQKWRMGMVTDALWHDTDADGFPELFVCGDWMPITVFDNQGGEKWANITRQLGLGQTAGFWNTLNMVDLDKDGEPELLAGNSGLNAKLKASVNNPLKLYLDDFDQNGQSDPILFYWKNGVQIPWPTRDELTKQLPFLKKQFLSYENFSKVTSIEQLTGKPESEIVATLNVVEMRSGYFELNAGTYQFYPFPMEAQMSTIESIDVAKGLNQEQQIIFVGNFFGTVTSLGAFDARASGSMSYQNGILMTQNELSLPNELQYRQLLNLGSGKFVVLSNDNNAYVITQP